MKILVIGSGGREHALVWKIRQSRLADKIFCAPGNGGIEDEAECLDIKAQDTAGLLDFARKEKIDLTVVGPEAPLAAGISDEFAHYDLRVFGPSRRASQLEASKAFAKEVMARNHVPTALFRVFDNADEAKRHIEQRGAPCVVKADGLAAGKGVVVAETVDEAKAAVSLMMEEKAFGAAGSRVVVEDCLQGEEASILVFTDSREVVPLASSQDHKRIFDDDRGPNTGGMGAYSPAPLVGDKLFREVLEKVVHPTIGALAQEGIEYAGVLYAGIMVTAEGPKVLEYNVRFGDPETQAILPRMQSDLVEVMLAVADRKLGKISKAGGLQWDTRSCVCVVVSSKGYPGDYEKGKEITGLAEAGRLEGVKVFHAASKKSQGKYFTGGGRVLGVTALGGTLPDSIAKAYEAAGKINFEGMHYRRDIGRKALARAAAAAGAGGAR